MGDSDSSRHGAGHAAVSVLAFVGRLGATLNLLVGALVFLVLLAAAVEAGGMHGKAHALVTSAVQVGCGRCPSGRALYETTASIAFTAPRHGSVHVSGVRVLSRAPLVAGHSRVFIRFDTSDPSRVIALGLNVSPASLAAAGALLPLIGGALAYGAYHSRAFAAGYGGLCLVGIGLGAFAGLHVDTPSHGKMLSY
jgi:hypothetical protein